MAEVNEEYTHSGRVGGSLIAVPLFGALAAIPMGFIYAYITLYNPIIYVSFLVLAGFCYALGWTTARLGKFSKCRNAVLLGLMGLFVASVGLYSSWAAFYYAIVSRYAQGPMNFTLLQAYLDPVRVWNFLCVLHDQGWFTIGRSSSSTPVSGILLWIVWGIETLAILGSAAVIPYKMLKDWVYCESCNQWCVDKPALAKFGYATTQLLQRLKEGDLNALGELPPYKIGQPFISIRSQRCNPCGQTETCQIVSHIFVQGDKGLTEKKEELTKHLLLGPEALNALHAALIPKPVAAPVVNIAMPNISGDPPQL